MDSRTKRVRITHRGAVLVVAIVLAAAAAGTDVAQAQMVNPYAGIDWENVQTLHSFSHQHGSDPRVFWNMGFGGTEMRFYRLWDEALRSGRQCLGFFVKDHVFFGRGRNVLLVSSPVTATAREREHEALRAYRDGRFFGLLGALKTDESGQPVSPYDKSEFRFTRIAVKEDGNGRPIGIEVSVDGAERTKRPNTQIRFITDAGVAKVVDDASALFEFPRDAAGAVACRFVRVEAFAYPTTHLGGRPLTPDALAAMNVHEISRLHDRLGPFTMSDFDPSGTAPIPIVDVIFSQPILVRKKPAGPHVDRTACAGLQ